MIIDRIKKILPWQVKIIIKIILSRLPISYRFWSQLGLFRHGQMDDYSYAWNVLQKHSEFINGEKNWSGLELGPGDGLLSCLLAPALFSSGLVLVDVGDYAHKDTKRYLKQISRFIQENPGFNLPDYSKSSNLQGMINKANGRYLSQGLESLKLLNDESFDLIFSQAVLEHIRKADFFNMMNECFRILKPNGVASHVIDFKDHLGGNLNNLRFSSKLWEVSWFASRSGFYTNRLRLSEIIKICEDIGFTIEVCSSRRWKKLPIKRNSLAKEFENFSDDDLYVSGVHLIMRRL